MLKPEDKAKNERFWITVATLKAQKFSGYTWADICHRANINYSTFRSSKSNCAMPSASTCEALARLFAVPTYFLMEGHDDRPTKRRRAVADAIMDLDEPTFLLIERMLGLDKEQ